MKATQRPVFKLLILRVLYSEQLRKNVEQYDYHLEQRYNDNMKTKLYKLKQTQERNMSLNV